MEIEEISSFLKSLEDTLLVFHPLPPAQDSSGVGEKKFLMTIIERAIEDISFLTFPTSKENKFYGRTAFIWLFIERINNIDILYGPLEDIDRKKVMLTSFDNLCDWLNLHPDRMRELIAKKYNFPFSPLLINN